VGYGGSIIATSDGGTHWVDQSITKKYLLDGVSFPDAVHGWVVGAFGTVLSTSDGGNHWIEQHPVMADLYSVSFPDAGHGWVTGSNGLIEALVQ
jgi:photosystem II stability/assembly factor-like uncharacterized protein